MKCIRKLAVLVTVVAASASLLGQSAPDIENGFKPYGSYDGSNIDSVNLMNGNLMLHIPMPFSYPQRGGKINPKNILTVSSKQWNVQCVTTPNNTQVCSWVYGGQPPSQLMPPAPFGVGFDYTMDIALYRTTVTDTTSSGISSYTGFDYYLASEDGSTHQVVPSPNAALDGNGDPMSFDAVDTSGLHVDLSSPDKVTGIPSVATIIDRQGNRYQTSTIGGTCHSSGGQNGSDTIRTCSQRGSVATITDSNGNVYNASTQSPLDTMGRTFTSFTGATGGDTSKCVTNGLPLTPNPYPATTYTYAGPNGTSNQFTVCYASLTVQTSFGLSGVNEAQNGYGVVSPLTATVPVTVIMPDGGKWVFQYDSYADITYVGMPLGGSISYTWETIAVCPSGQYGRTTRGRALTSRTINDNNGHSFLWNYSWGTPTNGSLVNTVTDSNLNDTVHSLTALDGPGGCMFYETSIQSYEGTGGSRSLQKQVDTAYSSATFVTSTDTGGLGNVFATSIKTTVFPSKQVSLVQRTPDPGLGTNQPIFGQVTKELQYDWGQGAPGALLREVDTTYQWQIDSRYLTARLLDLQASIVTKDANGNKVAETDYTYDETNYLTNYTADVGPLPTGTHVAAPNPVSGNLTTVSKWLSTGGSVISHTNWYDTGEVYKQIDPLVHTTTHSYHPAYAGAYSTQTCAPPTNSGAIAHCVSGTYDFNTGVLTSFTNENATAQANGTTPGDSAHTASYSYDLMSRLTSLTLPPDTGNGNAQAQTRFSYPVPVTLPFNVTRTKSINASLTDSLTTTIDGLGRPYQAQHATPNGAATILTQYDGLDHVISVTNPYFSTSDPTYGVIQTQYDALGRATQITEQDGGVKTVAYSVVPIGNATGDCGTTTDEIGNQKQSCMDALGRMTAVVEHNPTASTIFATGSVSINGTEQTATSQSAASGTGTVTISGVEAYMCLIPRGCSTNTYTYDSGTVWIQVGSYPTKTVTYGRNDTPATVAWKLSCAFHNDSASPVDAPCPSSAGTNVQVNFTARGVGASTNYSFSVGSSTNDSTNFGVASFDGSPTSGVFTGGRDASTTADTGTVSITVQGTAYSTTYGANDTSATIATRLATAVSGGAYANASASGNVISLISRTGGPSGDYPLSASDTYDSAHFSQPSFTTSTSGANLTGGDGSGDIANAPYVTLYQYNPRSDLLCVHQKATDTSPDIACTGTTAPSVPASWRQRFFTYDSLSRVVSANNPESGTVSYSYDADGNLSQKTSPAPNQTGSATQTISYCYDELNRITGKAYSAQTCQGTQLPSGTAVVSYVYDQGTNAKGKLTSLVDQAGSANYGYDVLQRLATEQRTLNGASKTISYEYNLDNSVKVLHYPSGAAVSYTPWNNGTIGASGLVQSAIDSGNGINYATAAAYDATGDLTSFVTGNSGSFSGLTNSVSFNKRLQPVFMSAASPTQTVFSIGYDFHLGNGDNGNVFALTNNRDTTRNQTFTYDALNRLISAQNAGTDCTQTVLSGQTKFWGNTYGYDAWGNLLSKTVSKCSAENMNSTALANNQLSGYSYDAAGNMTHDSTSGNNYGYDAENRITGAAGYTYTYDGDSSRVVKSNGSTGTLYWYMTPGIVAESDLAGNLRSEYVFFDGERIARKDFPSNAVSYYFSDRLKTADVVTDAQGNIKSESDYYPWGGELQFTNTDSNHYKFTGKERDQESGLDNFGARYYSNGLGRFAGADPVNSNPALLQKVMGNPQNLNAYQYANGSPLAKTDLGGYLTVVIPGTFHSPKEWYSRNNAFVKQVGKTFGERAVVLGWSGGNHRADRTAAAAQLNAMIKDHHFKVGEKLNIVTSSHGGNIAFEASGSTPHHIDNLVTLGPPIRSDYSPNMTNVTHLVNVWSPHDDIQTHGGGEHDWPGIGEWGPAGRVLPEEDGVTNVEADEATGHSDLWRNPNVWNNEVVPNLSGGSAMSGGDSGYSVAPDIMVRCVGQACVDRLNRNTSQ